MFKWLNFYKKKDIHNFIRYISEYTLNDPSVIITCVDGYCMSVYAIWVLPVEQLSHSTILLSLVFWQMVYSHVLFDRPNFFHKWRAVAEIMAF